LVVLFKGLLRSVERTSAASIALLVIFMVRGFFEVPLHVHGVIGSEVFAFLALLICAVRTDRPDAMETTRQRGISDSFGGPLQALRAGFGEARDHEVRVRARSTK
jgi:hypothetical protein